jgi:hypothetical protein
MLCAVAGCFTGFGIDTFLQKEDTKDNTLVRTEYDGVFFSEEISEMPTPSETKRPTVSPTEQAMEAVVSEPINVPTVEPTAKPTEVVTGATEERITPMPTVTPQAILTLPPVPTATPSVASTVTPTATSTPLPTRTLTPTPTVMPEEVRGEKEWDKQEVITYPTEIFGQVPVINRTDETVTYFEFAMDLIRLLEREIRQKNLNEISLYTKFMMKALLCGIKIEELQINEPVSRRRAALAVHLAAEVMGKKGTVKNAKNITSYVTDAGGCSAAEKKAIIYLYERAVTESGNRAFRPDVPLTEGDCSVWMKYLKAEWE